jgi:pyrroline-5-carboxylate reductase
VVSFAAANPLKWLEAVVPVGVSVIRVMPNGSAYIQQGMNPVVYGQTVTPEARTFVEALLPLLGKSIEVRDDQMTWCVGLSGAGLRTVLPVLEGMTRAGIEAGFSADDARRIAAQVMLGTAALALETDLSFEEIKALTPMQTLDETAVAQLFYDTACATKGKVDGTQLKLRAHALDSVILMSCVSSMKT